MIPQKNFALRLARLCLIITVLSAAVFSGQSICAQSSDFTGIVEKSDQPIAPAAPSEEKILPDSPLYSLKIGLEKLITFLTFKPASKAERYVELAEKRVSEMRTLVEEGKATEEAVETNAKKFEDNMDKALNYAEEMRKKGEDVEKLMLQISDATAKYQSIGEDFYGRLPEPVRKTMEDGVETVKKAYQEVLSAIPEQTKKDVTNIFEKLKIKCQELWDRFREKISQ